MAVNGKRTPQGDVDKILSIWDEPANDAHTPRDLKSTILSEWDDPDSSASNTPTPLEPTNRKESKKKTTKRKPHTKPSTRRSTKKTKTQPHSDPTSQVDSGAPVGSATLGSGDAVQLNELPDDVLDVSSPEPVIQSASSTIVDDSPTDDTESLDDDVFGGGFGGFLTDDDLDHEKRAPDGNSESFVGGPRRHVPQDDEIPDPDDYSSIWDGISKDPKAFAAQVMNHDVDRTSTSTTSTEGSNDDDASYPNDGVQTGNESASTITSHQDADGNEVLDLSILDDDYVDDPNQDSLTSGSQDTLESDLDPTTTPPHLDNALQSIMGPLQQRLNQNGADPFTGSNTTSHNGSIDDEKGLSLESPVSPLVGLPNPDSPLTSDGAKNPVSHRASDPNNDKIRHTTDNKDALEDLFDSYEQDLSEIEEMRRKTEAEKERNRRPLGKIKRAHEASMRKHQEQASDDVSRAQTGFDSIDADNALNGYGLDSDQSNGTTGTSVSSDMNLMSSIPTPTDSYTNTHGTDESYMGDRHTDGAMSIQDPIGNVHGDSNGQNWNNNSNRGNSAAEFDSYRPQQSDGVAYLNDSPSTAIPLPDDTTSLHPHDANDYNGDPQFQLDDGSWDNADTPWNATNDDTSTSQSFSDGSNSFDQYDPGQFESNTASAIASAPTGTTDGVPMSYDDDAEWTHGGRSAFEDQDGNDAIQSPDSHDQHSGDFGLGGNPFAGPDDDDTMISLGDGVLDAIDEGDSFDLGRGVDGEDPGIDTTNGDEEAGAPKSLGGKKKRKKSLSKSDGTDNDESPVEDDRSTAGDLDAEDTHDGGIGSLFKGSGSIKEKIAALVAQMKSEFHGGDGSKPDADPTDSRSKTSLSKSKGKDGKKSKDAESDGSPKGKKPRKSPKEMMDGVVAAVKNPKQLISTVRSAFKTAKKTTWVLIAVITLVVGVWGGSNIPAITNKGGVTEEAVDEGSVSLVGTSWSDGKAKITMRNDSDMVAHVSGTAEVRSWAPTFNPATWLTARVTASCSVPSVEVDPGAEKTVDAKCGKTSGVWHRIRASLSYE